MHEPKRTDQVLCSLEIEYRALQDLRERVRRLSRSPQRACREIGLAAH